MSWSASQKGRLAVERNLLERYFPNRVTWFSPGNHNAHVQIRMTSNSNKEYVLRVYIPSDFPNSCPDMVMVSPLNLRKQNGDALPTGSFVFHTIGERDSYIKLCHFIPRLWTADNTLYQVFVKGRLWIEAYEGHLMTGKDMDVFLKHQTDSNAGEAAGGCVLL